MSERIDVVRLARELIDIPSVTGEEFQIGTSLAELLNRRGYRVELQEVADERANIIATTGAPPRVVLSTHMDTVPPFIASSEDDEFVYGRGACDAKGIIAAMVKAAEQLLAASVTDFGLLLVVGEEIADAIPEVVLERRFRRRDVGLTVRLLQSRDDLCETGHSASFS